MNGVVVDASIALAWCFPDEASDYADAVLVALEGKSVLVPGVWGLELANAVLTGERAKRIGAAEIRRFLMLLGSLPLEQDAQDVAGQFGNVVPVARKHRLSSYDAAYLELAMRYGVPLSTLDGKLKAAARREKVEVFEAVK